MLGNLNIKWIVIAVGLIVSVAGAAVGSVLTSNIGGQIPVSVSQALLSDKPIVSGLPAGSSWFSSTSDDKSSFSAAAEAHNGDVFNITVPIQNRSNQSLVAQLDLELPITPMRDGTTGQGITARAAGTGCIVDVVRIGPGSWRFTVPNSASGISASPPDGVTMTITLSSTVMPGFYEMAGQIKTLDY